MNRHRSQIIESCSRALASAGVIALCVLFASAAVRAQDSDKLTLHQAVTLAVQNSRDVKLAQVQYNVALGEAGVDRAAFRPNLYTGSGAAYTHGFPSLPGGEAPSLFQLDYTQVLFNPLLKGQQHAAEDRAKNQKTRTRSRTRRRDRAHRNGLSGVGQSTPLARPDAKRSKRAAGKFWKRSAIASPRIRNFPSKSRALNCRWPAWLSAL